MRESFRFKAPAWGVGQLRENIGGVLVAIAGKRAQRLEFSRGVDPLVDVAASHFTPSLDGHGNLRRPEQHKSNGSEDHVFRPVQTPTQPA